MRQLGGWSEDATTAMQNGAAYFEWWDRVKTGVLVAGLLAVAFAWHANERSKR
jgi:hypothetical protein